MEQTINGIFSKRLRQARYMRGLSLETLSKQMNPSISKQAISKYEQGKMMPDSRVLLSLSAALGLKVDYFFRPYTISLNKVEFRKKAKCSAKRTKSIQEYVYENLERYLEIEQIGGNTASFNIKPQKVNSLKDARELALKVRAKFQLGNDGISNVIEVLEEYGVKVIEVKESNDFDGLCGYANDVVPIIVVNANFPAERKRFTALHELGHLLMEIPDNVEQKEIEHWCNAFANELLLPFSVLSARIGLKRHDISLTELIDIQQQYGISIEAIMYTLKEHDVITGNRYLYFNIKKSKSADFKENVQRSRIPQEYSGRFSRMVYRALADELISISKAATLLNSSMDSVKNRLQLI